MEKALTLYSTTIGKKAVVALTGLVLFGFVVGHMLGNLQVFLGPDQLNDYAKHLRELAPLLWLARIILAVAFVAHIVTSAQLWFSTLQARGSGYRRKQDAATSYAARTMLVSGPLILLFVAFHIAHFTLPGLALSSGYSHSHNDVYANVINGFSIPLVAALYILAQVLLGFHLYHGGWSLLQTLGMNHPYYSTRARQGAQLVAMLVVVGNISIPLAVLSGLVR